MKVMLSLDCNDTVDTLLNEDAVKAAIDFIQVCCNHVTHMHVLCTEVLTWMAFSMEPTTTTIYYFVGTAAVLALNNKNWMERSSLLPPIARQDITNEI